jgi:hypothetical protein
MDGFQCKKLAQAVQKACTEQPHAQEDAVAQDDA